MASIVLFFWAYYTGQFSDQGRARYLPLRGTRSGEVSHGAKLPFELIMLLAGAGAILLFTLFLALAK